MTLFTQTLPLKTATLVEKLQAERPHFLSSFYLSGGTALSLQIGHRESEDLDFFNQHAFDPRSLEQEAVTLGTLSGTELETGTVNTFIDEVKVQFLEYPYPLLEPFVMWDGIQLSSILDIACTKLQTISMRGSKKDFVDLYFLLDRFSLSELLKATQKKYIASDYNQMHIVKSLVYFVEAEEQPMPRMHRDISWRDIKERISREVQSLPLNSL